MIEQITVFLENTEGRLSALCRTLAEANVNMSALTIADTADYGVVRIISDEPQRAREVLDAANYRVILTKVSAIVVPNEPGGLSKLLDTLDQLDLDIEYGYCFSVGDKMAIDVVKIRGPEKTDEAVRVIEAAGFKLLEQSDIK